MMARLLYVLSPAKTLDMARAGVKRYSDPALLSDAHVLVRPQFAYTSRLMRFALWSLTSFATFV